MDYSYVNYMTGTYCTSSSTWSSPLWHRPASSACARRWDTAHACGWRCPWGCFAFDFGILYAGWTGWTQKWPVIDRFWAKVEDSTLKSFSVVLSKSSKIRGANQWAKNMGEIRSTWEHPSQHYSHVKGQLTENIWKQEYPQTTKCRQMFDVRRICLPRPNST